MIEVLFLIGILVFYVIRAIQDAKKRQAQGQADGTALPDAVEPELQDALAEIREALVRGRERPPSPTGSADPGTSDEFHRVVTGRPDAEREFQAAASEWRTPAGPRKEDQFERKPTEWTRKPAARLEDRFEQAPTSFVDPLEGHSHVKDDAVPDLAQGHPRKPRYPDARALKEAFIAAEVLGPPRAFKRLRDR